MDAITQYKQWILSVCGTFCVPGLTIPLPIDKAYIKMQVLNQNMADNSSTKFKEKFDTWNEWKRTTTIEYKGDAEEVIDSTQRILLIGGPGAGKSTLCRKTAYQATIGGALVFWVQLPIVLGFIQNRLSIDEAILLATTDGLGLNNDARQEIGFRPDILIADGLDECDPHRSLIAEALRKWVRARPNTKVIISSRPIGHNPAWFDNFAHVALLPLDERMIKSFSTTIFTEMSGNEQIAKRQAKQFKQILDKNKLASLAARSPLLLSFMIQLYVEGVELGSRRSILYEQIFEMCRCNETRPKYDNIDSVIANRSINIIGWFLQTRQISQHNIVDIENEIAKILSKELNILKLSAEQLARETVLFWIDKGILERRKLQNITNVGFLHLSLGEFAAARQIVNIPEQELRYIVRESYESPRWRETLSLAAGMGKASTIIEEVLSTDSSTNNEISIQPVLAADILAESQPDRELALRIIKVLESRLTSNIQYLVSEASMAISKIAFQAPEDIAKLVKPLLNHKNEWTSLGALLISISCGVVHADNNAIKAYFKKSSNMKKRKYSVRGKFDWWYFHNEIIRKGASCLVKRFEKDEVVGLLCGVKSNISYYTLQELSRILSEELQCEEAAQALFSYELKEKIDWDEARRKSTKRERKILEYIISATSIRNNGLPADYRPLNQISILLQAICPGDTPVTEWFAIGAEFDSTVMCAIISGTAAANDLNYACIRQDAISLAEIMDRDPYQPLSTLLKDVIIGTPKWELAKSLNVPVEKFIKAFYHPSEVIIKVAIQLVKYGHNQSDEAKIMIREIIWEGKYIPVWASIQASFALWEPFECKELLLSRLEGDLTAGCRWIYEALDELGICVKQKREKNIVIKGLECANYLVVIGAAQAIPIKYDSKVISKNVKESLIKWKCKSISCLSCGYKFKSTSSSCPKCHIVCETPITYLIRALANMNSFGMQEILNFGFIASDKIKNEVHQGVTHIITANPAISRKIVKEINRGLLPANIVESFFAVKSEVLLSNQHIISDLLNSSNAQLRILCLKGLMNIDLCIGENLQCRIWELVNDLEPDVRDEAVRVLRFINEKNVSPQAFDFESIGVGSVKADYALITALPEELEAVLKYEGPWERFDSQKTIRTYYRCRIRCRNGSVKTIIAFSASGMGRLNAAIAAKDMANDFSPNVIILVGIAAGLKKDKQKVGDILIPDQVVDYELQKLTSKSTEKRWEVYRADALLISRIKEFKDKSWISSAREKLEEMSIKQYDLSLINISVGGVVLSGDKVDDSGVLSKNLGETWAKAVGLEMESAGVASAVHQSRQQIRFIMIKSISDFVDGNQPKEAKLYAANVSAAYTLAMLKDSNI